MPQSFNAPIVSNRVAGATVLGAAALGKSQEPPSP